MSIGSLDWGFDTRGALSEDDRAELMQQLARAAQRLTAPSAASGPVDFVLGDVVVPDSKLAHDALALCRDTSDEWLVEHCVRSYLFGAGLGVRAAITFDPEILYVAALLHDLGITQRFEATSTDDCFAVAGARIALEFSRERASEDRATTIAEA